MVGRRKSLYGFEIRERDERRKDGERKTHDVKQLWQRSHEILGLALLGMKAPEIANVLRISSQTVSNTLNSELGMRKLSAMRLERDKESIDVMEEVARLYPLAIATYEKILQNDQASLGLRKEVADTVLMEIGGHKAPTRFQGQVAHAHLTAEEIEAMKRRGKEAARASGMLVELEAETEAKTGVEAKPSNGDQNE